MIGRKRNEQARAIASRGLETQGALGVEREIHHHDGVLLDDADQQQNAEEGDQAEFHVGGQQGQQGAHSGGRQRGQDGDRLAVALIQHSQHDIDGQERRQQHQRLGAGILLEETGRTVRAAVNGGRHVNVVHGPFDGGQRHARAIRLRAG